MKEDNFPFLDLSLGKKREIEKKTCLLASNFLLLARKNFTSSGWLTSTYIICSMDQSCQRFIIVTYMRTHQKKKERK